MTLTQLRREMPANELQYWGAFHKDREKTQGSWRVEIILAQIADLLFKANFKGKSKPIDYIPGIEQQEENDDIKPEQLIAWATANNMKHEKTR